MPGGPARVDLLGFSLAPPLSIARTRQCVPSSDMVDPSSGTTSRHPVSLGRPVNPP